MLCSPPHPGHFPTSAVTQIRSSPQESPLGLNPSHLLTADTVFHLIELDAPFRPSPDVSFPLLSFAALDAFMPVVAHMLLWMYISKPFASRRDSPRACSGSCGFPLGTCSHISHCIVPPSENPMNDEMWTCRAWKGAAETEANPERQGRDCLSGGVGELDSNGEEHTHGPGNSGKARFLSELVKKVAIMLFLIRMPRLLFPLSTDPRRSFVCFQVSSRIEVTRRPRFGETGQSRLTFQPNRGMSPEYSRGCARPPSPDAGCRCETVAQMAGKPQCSVYAHLRAFRWDV
jgi:hypothetical protein